VAYASSGGDTWSDQATDNSSDTATATLTATGTFGGGNTVGYAAAGFNGQDIVGGHATFAGTESSTAAETTSDAGQDNWSFSEQGTFGGQSFSLGSVVYRLSESDGGTVQDSSGDSFADSSAVTATETAQGGASNSVSMASVSGQDTATVSATLSEGVQEQDSSAFTDSGGSSDTLYEAGSYAGDCFAFASISYQASGSDNTSETDSSGGSNNSGLSGSDLAGSATSDGGGYGSTSDTGQQENKRGQRELFREKVRCPLFPSGQQCHQRRRRLRLDQRHRPAVGHRGPQRHRERQRRQFG